MSRDELLALEKRVETAEQDSVTLFEEVWETLCKSSLEFRRYACTVKDKDGLTATGRFLRFVYAGAFLDAAMLLVPEDSWHEIKGPRKYLNIPTPSPNYWSVHLARWNHEFQVAGWGATPALALVAAALRARAAQ